MIRLPGFRAKLYQMPSGLALWLLVGRWEWCRFLWRSHS
jgi:hypothetical protein